MPRRGENVYKRKDGRWEGRVLKSDGKYKSIYAKTYREVKIKQNNFRESAEIQRAENSACTNSATTLFQSWITNDIAERVKPSTYESYYWCLQKYVIPFFTKAENEKLTEVSVAQFSKEIKSHPSLSEAYKRKILTIFKLALKDILPDSYDAILLESIKLPKAKSKTVQVFSVMEQRLIEKVAIASTDHRTLGIILCFYTGIRLGELCALKWSDIDFEAGTISISRTVTRTKNFQLNGSSTTLLVGMPKSQKSIRKIPFPAFLLTLCNCLQKEKMNENYYVLSGSESPIDPRTFQKIYKKIVMKAGIKYRKFHAIRHTFATRALELGVDIKTLSEILGHANASITLNIYAHSLMEQKKIAIEKLNEMHLHLMQDNISAVNDPVK